MIGEFGEKSKIRFMCGLKFSYLVVLVVITLGTVPYKQMNMDNEIPFPILASQGHNSRVIGLYSFSNRSQILTVEENGLIRSYDADTYETLNIHSLKTKECSNCYFSASAISPNGNFLAVGGNLGPEKEQIWIIDLSDWAIIRVLTAHNGGVRNLKFSANGQILVSGGVDGTIKVWDTVDFVTLSSWKAHHNIILDLDVSSNGRFIVSSSRDLSMVVWSQQEAWRYQPNSHLPWRGIAYSVLFSPDDTFFVSATDDGQILKWALNAVSPEILIETEEKDNGALSFSRRGRYLCFSGIVHSAEEMLLEPLQNLDPNQTIPKKIFARPVSRVSVFDLEQNQLITQMEDHQNLVLCTRFYDEEKVISADPGPGCLRIWHRDTGHELKVWKSEGQYINAVSISNELTATLAKQDRISRKNEVLYSFDWQHFQLKKMDRHIKIKPKKLLFENKRLQKINDQKVAVVGDSPISLNPATDGKLQEFFFNSDASITIAGAYTIKRFSEHRERYTTFSELEAEFRSAATSESVQYLVTTSTNQIIKLWNAISGEHLASLYFEPSGEWVVWSPLGYYVCSKNGARFLKWFQYTKSGLPGLVEDQLKTAGQFRNPKLLRKIILSGASQHIRNLGRKDSPVKIRVLNREEQVVQNSIYPLKISISTGLPPKRLEIYQNNHLIDQIDEFKEDRFSFLFEKMVSLTPEKNIFTCKLITADGDKIQLKHRIIYRPDPKLQISSGHSAMITDMSYNLNQRFLASASLDNTIKVWDVNTSKLFKVLEQNLTGSLGITGFYSVDFHPNKPYVLCAVNSAHVLIFDVISGEILQELEDEEALLDHERRLKSARFVNDGESIVTIREDGYLKLWNVLEGSTKSYGFIHGGGATATEPSYDGRFLFTTGNDDFINVFMMEDLRKVRQIKRNSRVQHPELVNFQDFILLESQSNLLAVGGWSRDRVEVFDASNGTIAYSIPSEFNRFYTSGSFSKDGKYLLLSSLGKPVELFDAATGENLWKSSDSSTYSSNVIFAPKGEKVLFAHGVQSATIQSLLFPSMELEIVLGKEARWKKSHDISKDGNYLLSGGAEQTLWIWNLENASATVRKDGAVCPPYNHGIFDIAVSPTKDLAAVSYCDETIRIIDFVTNQILQEIQLNGDIIRSLDWSMDGRWLIGGGTVLKLWDMHQEGQEHQLGRHHSSIGKVQCSPDNKIFASADYNHLIIWDLQTHKEVQYTSMDLYYEGTQIKTNNSSEEVLKEEYFTKDPFDISFTADSRSVVIGGHALGSLIKYDIANDEKTLILDRNTLADRYSTIAVHPTKDILAAGSRFLKRIDIFDLKTNQMIQSFGGHLSQVNKLTFNKEGNQLLTSSHDGTVRSWDWATGREVMAFFFKYRWGLCIEII